MYVLAPDGHWDGTDHRFWFDCFIVVVDIESMKYLAGTEIDYVTEGLNNLFKFNNPNAKSLCGCGESFQIIEPSVTIDINSIK